MARFHFHFRERDERSRDDDGIEFSSSEDAYLAAYHGAVDMWSELLKERRDPRQCSFEVTNERDQVLFVLPFTEVLEACRGDTRQAPFGASPHATTMQAQRRARKSLKDFQREMKVTRAALRESQDLIQAVNRLAGDK